MFQWGPMRKELCFLSKTLGFFGYDNVFVQLSKISYLFLNEKIFAKLANLVTVGIFMI